MRPVFTAAFALLAASFFATAPLPAHARDTGTQDRVQFGRTLYIGPGESVGDAVCVGCSIRAEGDVNGDLVAVGGSVDVAGAVSGDLVTVGGSARLRDAASVGGDLVVVGGSIHRAPGAVVRGDQSNTGGGWLWLGLSFLLVPFLLLAGLIWLIVHLYRRRSPVVPVYAPPVRR